MKYSIVHMQVIIIIKINHNNKKTIIIMKIADALSEKKNVAMNISNVNSISAITVTKSYIIIVYRINRKLQIFNDCTLFSKHLVLYIRKLSEIITF